MTVKYGRCRSRDDAMASGQTLDEARLAYSLAWCSLSDTHHKLQPVVVYLFHGKITVYLMGKGTFCYNNIVVVWTTDNSFNIMIHFFQASLYSCNCLLYAHVPRCWVNMADLSSLFQANLSFTLTTAIYYKMVL